MGNKVSTTPTTTIMDDDWDVSEDDDVSEEELKDYDDSLMEEDASTAVGSTAVASAATSATAAAVTAAVTAAAATAATRTLSYPHDFLGLKSGLGPKTKEQAKVLWPFRKSRPAIGTVDKVPPDGAKMMAEVETICRSLKSHIERAFLKDAREMASAWKLVVPRTNQPPFSIKDFVRALAALKRVPGSLDSERIVYMVCHHFHHQRTWLRDAVDDWLRVENMKIDYPEKPKVVDGKSTRASYSNRGGFGVCARNVKVELVKRLMRNMLKRAGWCISTKDNSKQGKGRVYQAISIRIATTATDHTCYVVTQGDAGTKVAGKKRAAGSEMAGSSAARPIDVDNVADLGAHIAKELGGSVTEDRLQQILRKYKPPSDVLGREISMRGTTGEGEMSDLTITDTPGTNAAAIVSGAAAAAEEQTSQLPTNVTAAPSAPPPVTTNAAADANTSVVPAVSTTAVPSVGTFAPSSSTATSSSAALSLPTAPNPTPGARAGSALQALQETVAST